MASTSLPSQVRCRTRTLGTAFAIGIDGDAYGMQITEPVSTGYGSSDSNCASGYLRPSATLKLASMRQQNRGSLTLRNDDTFANSVLNKL